MHMLEKLRLLQYRARIKLYSSGQLRSTEIAGRPTQYLAAGSGAPTVVLAAPLGEAIWYPYLQGLARSFSVTAILPPGLDGAEDAYIDDLDDLLFHHLDLFAALGLDRFNLIGASSGGRIAAELAIRYPERIERLVLADSFGLDLPLTPSIAPAEALGDPDRLRKLLFFNPASFLGDMLIPSRPRQTDAVLTAMNTASRIGIHNPKLHARLARIKSPTLVVWGADDATVPFPHAEVFRNAVPDARLTRIPDCGHLPMFEREELFVAAVTSFLRAGETG